MYEAQETLFKSTRDKWALFALYNVTPRWLIPWIPFSVAGRMDRAREVLVAAWRGAARQRREAYRKGEVMNLDFLTNLAGKEEFDEDAAINQMLVILGAGYESTRGTLAWTMYCIAAHPEIQHALRDELTQAKGTQPTLDESQYDQLPFLKALSMAQMLRQIALVVERFQLELVDEGRLSPVGIFATSLPVDVRLRFTRLD